MRFRAVVEGERGSDRNLKLAHILRLGLPDACAPTSHATLVRSSSSAEDHMLLVAEHVRVRDDARDKRAGAAQVHALTRLQYRRLYVISSWCRGWWRCTPGRRRRRRRRRETRIESIRADILPEARRKRKPSQATRCSNDATSSKLDLPSMLGV